MADLENEGVTGTQSIRALGNAYNAQSITVEIGMDGQKGALTEAVKAVVLQFNSFRTGETDLRALRATPRAEDGMREDEINLIDEILTVKDELELPDNDPVGSYRVRREWLKAQMRAHG